MLALAGSATPTTPETSSWAPPATKIRPLPAETAICPACAEVSEPVPKLTVPPVVISMRDLSSSSASPATSFSAGVVTSRVALSAAEVAISCARCESSAVAVLERSGTISVRLFGARVMLPVVSLVSVSRWMVPRCVVVVVETATPAWVTACPTSVMSPWLAWIRPELAALPPPVTAISEPSVVASASPLPLLL